jgi:hypothetical protein
MLFAFIYWGTETIGVRSRIRLSKASGFWLKSGFGSIFIDALS